MRKRLFKIFVFALAGFIVLLILIGGLTQTRRFKNWLRDQIVKQAATTLNGTLRLGRIEGNLISDFSFHDLCIELDRDTLLYVPSIEVGLSPRELLKRHVLVSNLVFHAPVFSLRQLPDSAWNIAHLVKPAPPTAKPHAISPWRIALQNLQVENGALAFTPLDTASYKLLPRRIQKVSTAMRLRYADDHLAVVLRNLQLKALNPNLTLNSLTARVFLGHDSLFVRDFKLRSGDSHLSGQIALRHFARPIFDIALQGAPLQLDDLRAFIPNLKIAGAMQGSVHAIGDMQNVRATFRLEHADGVADGSFFVLQDSTTTFYNLEAAVRALNLTPYLRRVNGPTRLNFAIKLEGSGLTLDDLDANLALTIDSSQVLGRQLAQARLTAQARAQQIQVKLWSRAEFGALDLSAKLGDPQQQRNFEIDAQGRHFDLAKLLQNDTLASDVSFRLAGSGQNFEAAQLKFDGWLRVFPSRLPAVLLDSAYCQLHARGPDFQLDTLRLASSMGSVQAAGLLSLRYENNFRFRAELGDLTWARRAIQADTLRATGVITGAARGPLDSLAVAGRFDLRRVQYNRNSIKRLSGNLSFNRLRDQGTGMFQMKGEQMTMGYLPVDSAKALVLYDLRQAQIGANFWQGLENYGELDGLYTFGAIGRFEVRRAKINVLGQTWQTPADSAMWIEVGDENYDFHNCGLVSGSQRFYVNGRLSYIGAEDLNFRIADVDIAALATMMGSETSLSKNNLAGILALDGHLTGHAEAPILHGKATWTNGRIADFAFENWEGEFGYANEQFSWQFTLHQNQNRRLTGEGYLPMNWGLNNTGKVLYDDRPIRIQVATSGIETGIDLAFLQTLTRRVKQVQGTLVFDLKLENTLQAPRAKGAARIIDGAFSIPEYGVSYNDVQLVATIDSASVQVNDLRARSDKGNLKASGQLNFTPGAIGEVTGSLKATDFLVILTRDMELRLDADISGTSNTQGARYRGGITVDRSRFFLPALQQSSVIRLEEKTAARAAPADSAPKPAAASPMQRWLQNLHGELKIKIPRNTWIRGPELNAEIEGSLDFIQEGITKFLSFGTLNIIRGTYELFGKRFDIEKGQITFQGDLQNPQFDLEAQHLYRAPGGDREKKSLEVRISGSITNPQIQFLQNGEPLDEKDALANLVFGIDFDQLFYSQGKELESELGKSGDKYAAAAKGLVSGLVSQQLAKSLGRSLNLDVIEFQGADDLSQTSVLVGKYITNDLFISFSQEPEGHVVSMELELFKFLFLQAAQGGEENRKTGFDFIWKLDW